MIIRNKKENKENKEEKKSSYVKNFDVKSLIFVITLVVISLLLIVLFTRKTSEQKIYIEVVSQNVEYTYNPAGQSSVKIDVNQNLKLGIFADNKKNVKCYSTDESKLEFIGKDEAISKSKGIVEVYCKAKDQKSNIIEINIGG